ncbi:MAG TPA: FAD binding domain-containing protein [Candidatus Eisenbacteria bacterium]|nr:FAD binding domain-containing protein [Candidatus Eisenbacteria bacterium]
MLKFRNYVKVETREEYEKTIAAIDGSVKLLAGGSDLLVQAREDDRFKDCTIVDIFGIEELHTIKETDDHLIIGACASHEAIAKSPLILSYAPILAEAALSVGSLQIRNHSSIGGNIINASPAADTLAPLAILYAELIILKNGVENIVSLSDIFEGPYKTTLEDRDLLLSIKIPKLSSNVQYNYTKVGRRKALAISRMTIATLLETDIDGIVTRFDMTVGATFPTPMRFSDISEMLVGKRPTNEDIREVAAALSAKIPEIAGIRASTQYKQPVCRRLCERILQELIGDEYYEQN